MKDEYPEATNIIIKEIKAKTHRETIRMCWRDINGNFNSRPKYIDDAIFITSASREDLKRKWGIKG